MTRSDRLGARSVDHLQVQLEELTHAHVLEITEGSSNRLEVAYARTAINRLMARLTRTLPRIVNLLLTYHA